MAPISSTLPKTQTAVIASPEREFMVSHDVAVTEIEPYTVIIKTAAVALNPVDTKLHDDFITPGVIFGFDCAGTVVAIGPEVKKDLKIGDRVCGSSGGMDPLRPSGGGFAEYSALHGEMCLKVPEGMSFEDAATLGTSINSAALALFSSLDIPWTLLKSPAQTAFPVLVYGGSTSVGTMAIQLLKMCGLRPITTCSPKNFDFVKSFGAEQVFDYHSATCGKDIRAYTKNSCRHALDCITTEASMKICYEAIGRAGGRYTALDPFPHDFATHFATRKIIKPDWIVAFRILGQPCNWPAPFTSEADPEVLKWSIPMYNLIERYLAEGKIQTHPKRVSNGFDAILDGVGMLRRKEVSAQKLVYTIS